MHHPTKPLSLSLSALAYQKCPSAARRTPHPSPPGRKTVTPPPVSNSYGPFGHGQTSAGDRGRKKPHLCFSTISSLFAKLEPSPIWCLPSGFLSSSAF
ncbi:hypothetical protein GW17_00032545 [Ensete ventricosum]|nr:hypothetical protein GW17_00032545 [Ensete ventricosum]RZS03288.1 hypothetical protein BHM03_00033455 [Ensete ventricosum]